VAESAGAARRVVLGNLAGAYGVHGWVKVRSHTDPLDNILHYSPWRIEHKGQTRDYTVLSGSVRGGFVVARLEGLDVREEAMALAGAAVSVDRACLPPLPKGEYYWADLIGLEVVNREGISFGKLSRLFETGANDVLVADDGERERFIPYVSGMYVLEVDLAAGRMLVDWDAEF
jgi:16S rRNA processing protein RimM